MLRPSLICLVLSGLALLSGCQVATWQPGGNTVTATAGDYAVRVPAQWMFVERPAGLVATNDGLFLQRAGIYRHDLKRPLAYSKRTLQPNATPLELAEAVADDMRADRALHELNVSEIQPAEVGGLAGCKLTLQFHDEENLRFTQVIYACLSADTLYLLHFKAPTRHYFAHDAAAFAELVGSFRITAKRTVATPPEKTK